MPYYAVAEGYNPGIYRYWDECMDQVEGYSGNVYCKRYCYAEAKLFLSLRSIKYSYDCGDYGEHEDNIGYYYAIAGGKYPGIYHLPWEKFKHLVYGKVQLQKYCCLRDAQYFMERQHYDYYEEFSDDSDDSDY